MSMKLSYELSPDDAATMVEALSYLHKQMLLDPRLREDATVSVDEVEYLMRALDEQHDGIELVQELLKKPVQ